MSKEDMFADRESAVDDICEMMGKSMEATEPMSLATLGQLFGIKDPHQANDFGNALRNGSIEMNPFVFAKFLEFMKLVRLGAGKVKTIPEWTINQSLFEEDNEPDAFYITRNWWPRMNVVAMHYKDAMKTSYTEHTRFGDYSVMIPYMEVEPEEALNMEPVVRSFIEDAVEHMIDYLYEVKKGR